MRSILISLLLVMTTTTSIANAQEFDPMMMADNDQNGLVSLEEFTAFSAMGWSYLTGGVDKVKVGDLSADAKAAFAGVAPDVQGYITQDAYMAALPAKFKAADKNGDGSLDSVELKASMAAK